MSDLRTAAQQALQAMEKNTKHLPLHFDNYFEAMNALRAALAEPVQEPVAWRFQSAVGGWAYGSQPPLGSKYPAYPLYTAPPQRKPLTEEEIEEINRDLPLLHMQASKGSVAVAFARAIERAHGICE